MRKVEIVEVECLDRRALYFIGFEVEGSNEQLWVTVTAKDALDAFQKGVLRLRADGWCI